MICLKTLYLGDTLAEAAQRAGADATTVGRWIDRWNKAGIDGLQPSFGGGKPPKLTEQQQERVKRVLAEYQPWTTTEVRLLIEEAFDVSYSKRHVSRLLREFGMSYSIPRPEDPNRPDDADKMLGERLLQALAELTDDDLVDGGIIVDFWTKPGHSRRRLSVGCGPLARRRSGKRRRARTLKMPFSGSTH